MPGGKTTTQECWQELLPWHLSPLTSEGPVLWTASCATPGHLLMAFVSTAALLVQLSFQSTHFDGKVAETATCRWWARWAFVRVFQVGSGSEFASRYKINKIAGATRTLGTLWSSALLLGQVCAHTCHLVRTLAQVEEDSCPGRASIQTARTVYCCITCYPQKVA